MNDGSVTRLWRTTAHSHTEVLPSDSTRSFEPHCTLIGLNAGSVSITGGFPTTTALDGANGDKLLGDPANATVQTMCLLMGVPGEGDLGDTHVLANRIPTTIQGGYTGVPAEQQYAMFQAGLVTYRRGLLGAGVQVLMCS